VIIANGFELVPEYQPLAANQWNPNRMTLILLVSGIPIVAIIIAWLVYRSSQSHPYQPGKVRTKQIYGELNRLKERSDIQTDREKVQELYRADFDDV
jgi:hypothetical protein